ncbi:chaperone SurA [Jannaschia pagri]|uniref:Parvulin-like PPIase n=1 Tax=Jannaschia pagri TaxID=2829797 RepID=A0ABQ4NGB7_9RHOB|nr:MULTISPECIES: peptidylprolyl isomerase [unclassified Jannaschia]GIT90426.1 chaperone SurA [Jannaschia sp. AI_61]GIT93469.1 chaperone SurA [Jannaschia sp. AI_62]
MIKQMKRLGGALALVMLAATGPLHAQGQPFAPVVIVNGTGVTNFQIDQRARFLSLLGAPNADLASARETMVDETLQVQAARAAGIELTAEELDAGMVEFAARAGLEPAQFIEILERGGIAGETFRDFVRNGLYWRQLVQQRFGPQARPSEAEIDRTLARGTAGGVRVLLSEIALPQTPENRDEVAALARQLSETISSEAAFQQAARQYSRSASARRGGRIDWLSLSQLPPPLVAQVLALGPGQVSNPVDLGAFVGLYLLRDLDESGVTRTEALSVDYAEYLIPGGRSQEALARAAQIQARIDTCDDLYGVAKGQPPEVLTRTIARLDDLPGDLRQELAKLDDDEVSTLLTRGGNLRFVMLCGRVVEPPEGAFEAVGQQLLNERLTSYAQGYLAELRSDAIIEDG